jgi:hypothetical protein
MARIRIEDLPVETLTPEEMEEILGAGRFEFKPTFEALEDRQLMAAGFGGSSLGAIMAQHKMQVNALIQHVAQHKDNPTVADTVQNREAARALQTDPDLPKLVADQTAGIFNTSLICGGRFANLWMLQRVTGTQQWWQNEAHTLIGVKVNFTYGLTNDGNKGSVVLYFAYDKSVGNSLYYKYSTISGLEWEGAFAGDHDKLANKIDTEYHKAHICIGSPSEAEMHNVVRAASSQFMRDIVGQVAQLNLWRMKGIVSASGAIEGSTIQVKLKVEVLPHGSNTMVYHTFNLAFQRDHFDAQGTYYKIVDVQFNVIDNPDALRDKVTTSFTNSPVFVGTMHEKAATDIANKDLEAFKLLCVNEGKNIWGIKSAELDPNAWYDGGTQNLSVAIKLTREGTDGHGDPFTYESTLILSHRYVTRDGWYSIFMGSSATVETNGRTNDISLAPLTTFWTALSAGNPVQRLYDQDGNYRGDGPIPPPHAGLETQGRSAVNAATAPLPVATDVSTADPAKPTDAVKGQPQLIQGEIGAPPQHKDAAPRDAYFAAKAKHTEGFMPDDQDPLQRG